MTIQQTHPGTFPRRLVLQQRLRSHIPHWTLHAVLGYLKNVNNGTSLAILLFSRNI